MNIFEKKFKKLLSGKLFWDFKSFFKWGGLEVDDFRKYYPGDDKRSINWKLSAKHWEFLVNLYKEQKDTNIYVFFDINKNWLWYNDNYVKDKVFDVFSSILIFSKQYSANLIWVYEENWNIYYEKIGKNINKAFIFVSKLENKIKDTSYNYKTNINTFLDYQKKINKSSIIIMFSDFLWLDENWKKLIKVLWQKNELMPVNINLNNISWINYTKFTFSKKTTWIDDIFLYNL